jgi:hypothetical protein
MRRFIRKPIAAPLAALVALTLLAALDLRAQTNGTPIRLQTAAKPGHWITGMAAGAFADSVAIIPRQSPDTLRYARSDLHRMEVSRGRKSNADRGALIGGGIVGAFGLGVGIACANDEFLQCTGGDVALVTFTGAVSGAALGALIGALSHRELREDVKVAPHVAGGEGGRVRAGLSLAF